jgi:hypothetical protein
MSKDRPKRSRSSQAKCGGCGGGGKGRAESIRGIYDPRFAAPIRNRGKKRGYNTEWHLGGTL